MTVKQKNWLPVIVVLVLLLLWELAVYRFQIPLYVLPAPSRVFGALYTEAVVLAGHGLVTVWEAVFGMVIALFLSLLLGILMDGCRGLKACLYPLLVVTQTVPMIVLAPILIIYLGFGMAPKILTVVLMCFFPIVVSFIDGMEQMDHSYAGLARSYGARGWQIYRLVKIPGSIPSLLSGLKVAATYSISGAVVGEWIGAQKGLGYYLLRVKNGYMLDKVFACVLVIVLLSLLMNGLIRLCSYLALPHKRRQTNLR